MLAVADVRVLVLGNDQATGEMPVSSCQRSRKRLLTVPEVCLALDGDLVGGTDALVKLRDVRCIRRGESEGSCSKSKDSDGGEYGAHDEEWR